ncbi:AAA family ATPase [Shewanella sp. ZOR0012]|uniref:NB-ARC domain-containing protein n=1 Tax=Shewanella sp. ZOR0012 TaxID=1339231 RepID=UPI0006469162|nr:NB-ARC domain-containing protein [Shewanella sp. ZOR0012]NSM26330.1 AAA family ATPase [Shewanella sp. ZOR0012]
MSFNLTRMTIYALIAAIEEDLRLLIKAHIVDEKIIDTQLIARSKDRIKKDIGSLFGEIELQDIIDYFDLGDTFTTINTNRAYFPEHVSKLIKNLTKNFETIVSIRNRVMHIRPLNFDDLPIVSEFCKNLLDSENALIWQNIDETLNKLKEDPSFVLSLDILNYDDDESINHNLPIPDFDETGLIGRDKEVEQVKKLCLGGFPVISIVGEGGVGKSALALKVAYELIEKDSPFDAVVWVTSKTTQITLNEIKEIKGAINSSIGVIQEIGKQVVGDEFNNNNLEEVIEYLATFKIALFIDNLETILDENIRQFVGALPQGSKIIITSRIGLGAYEYPIKLQGIGESYASQLLRTVAQIRNVDALSKLHENVLRGYVNRMHRNPSYIKWFVSSVQTGLSPEAVLQNSDNFLDFCMSNVYEYLSPNAQKLTKSMQCAQGLKDIPELTYLNDFEALEAQKAIQELMATNMLLQSSIVKGASVKTTYQLSELARAYLGKHHKPSQAFQKEIRDKRNKLNSIFEDQMSRRTGNKYSPRNIQFRDKSDRVIARKLYDAQNHIKNAEHDLAFEILQEAQRLAPDYFEVARFMAYFHQNSGNISDAREQYELAIVLSPNTPQLHYWFGKFLLHIEENVDEAVEQFKMAHDLDMGSAEISLSLARGYLFQHEFDKTQDIITQLSESIDNADEHLFKMYLDTEIQVLYRRADDFSKYGDFDSSIDYLEKMKSKFEDLRDKYKDRHIRQKLKKCNYTLSKILKSEREDLKMRAADLSSWIEIECFC